MMMGSEGEHADDDSMCDMTMYADVLCRLRHTLQENLLMTQQQARTGLASRVVRRRCVAIDTVAGAGRAFTAGDVRRTILCRVAC